MKTVIDVETGGWSITKNAICEIGILFLDEKLNIVGEYEALIKPYTRSDDTEELVSYKEEAMNVNGISVWDLEYKGIDVEVVSNEVKDLLIEYDVDTLIGHNVKFDFDRVGYLLKRFCDFELVAELENTVKLAKAKHKGLKSYKLDELGKELGFTNEQEHRAIGDCKATLDLYKLVV